MLYGITDLSTFILGTIFIVLLPGPNSVYVMTVASRWGVAAGYRGAAGIFVGDAILMVLSASGVASLLRSTPELFMALKYAGAAYLCWLGLGLLRAAWRMWRSRGDAGHDTRDEARDGAGNGAAKEAANGTDRGARAAATTPPADGARPFRTALLISLMNPKAYLFMLAVFPQFLRPEFGPLWRQAAVMVLMIWATQLVVYGGLAVAAARGREVLVGSPQATRLVGRMSGLLLITVAIVTLWRGWGGS